MEPAIKQINDNPEGSGLRVWMKALKESRSIKWVVFEVIKTKERQAIDATLKDRDKQLDLFDVRLRPDTHEKARELAPGWDLYMLEAEWREWGAQQPGWPPDKPDGAFLGFRKQRGAYSS